ncbi:argininosuccinate synthase [Anaerosphaera aminiphila DSM 21120]|uniref:Argininosuccinate synthase n=1 Tax=Anaerosphaera aminiphila DSM 21120 TaxID=1120995 RepID=A0A1M5U0P9_9FIRM|nr:argininosuccinate synthase [Anaerosphaera aminiphila]SHH56461.1 argininosuccinate synthase [Anaerosphaera aminiphila DSM 21120]
MIENNTNIKKVVLAYSGGLDTSITIPWLKENYGCEVIAVVGNVGQDNELDGLEEKAIQSGASKIFIEDLTDEFVEEFVFETLKAGAKYEGKYLLGTSFARPVIAKKLVEIAHSEGADAIAHGCTGKGNDQVRFELAVKAFDPDMEIIAPWRTWELKSREDEIEYAKERNIPLPMKEDNIYSEDRNIWHISHEGLDLEFPDTEPDFSKVLKMSVPPEDAPDEPTYISIAFEKGVPVAIDGKKMKGTDIIKTLNKIGGANGIGIDDIVENRLVGMKVRGVYENPGGAILYRAHEILESITLDGDTKHYKDKISIEFANVVYNGKWFSPLRESLSAFVNKTQETVTGDVKLKLYKGNIITAGVTSPYTLYSEEFATFGEDGVYDQNDSQGFVNLYALSTKVQSMMKKKVKESVE